MCRDPREGSAQPCWVQQGWIMGDGARVGVPHRFVPGVKAGGRTGDAIGAGVRLALLAGPDQAVDQDPDRDHRHDHDQDEKAD
jgi:hypothetical protein